MALIAEEEQKARIVEAALIGCGICEDDVIVGTYAQVEMQSQVEEERYDGRYIGGQTQSNITLHGVDERGVEWAQHKMDAMPGHGEYKSDITLMVQGGRKLKLEGAFIIGLKMGAYDMHGTAARATLELSFDAYTEVP